MKLIIPGIVVTALVLTSPAAFAQMGPGYTSTPGSSVAKDEKTTRPHEQKNTLPVKRHTMPSTWAPKLKQRALAVHRSTSQRRGRAVVTSDHCGSFPKGLPSHPGA